MFSLPKNSEGNQAKASLCRQCLYKKKTNSDALKIVFNSQVNESNLYKCKSD